jgi:hypothetical protein
MPCYNQHDSSVTERQIRRHATRKWEFIVNGSVDSGRREHYLCEFGDAFARQGRFNEAEKMYQRRCKAARRHGD